MTTKIRYILLAVICACAMASCTDDKEVSQISLPLTVSLPTNDHYSMPQQSSCRRVIGDPGTTEIFLLPQHLYFFVLLHMDSGWKVMHAVHTEPQPDEWIKRRYTGQLQTEGDSIYQYTETFSLPADRQGKEGMVFAVASAVPLTFNREMNAISSLEQVVNLTFDASSATVQENLQHIYSSPYNYMQSGAYYGSFHNTAGLPARLNLMLYHVAAKVDLQWNVADSMRIRSNPLQAVRLTYMEARRLYNGNAYCFKPLRNTMADLPESGGYDIPDIVTEADEGLWWEGRTYFYTIPYTVTESPGYFPLQLLMCTNGTMKGYGYKLTLCQPIDTSAVFVPWLRGRFNLSKPLTDKSETKIIE